MGRCSRFFALTSSPSESPPFFWLSLHSPARRSLPPPHAPPLPSLRSCSGAVVLALPIAVVGVTFDEEWAKQTKSNRFSAVSTVAEYNSVTRNGTRAVTLPARPLLVRMEEFVRSCANARRRVAPHPEQSAAVNANGRGADPPATPEKKATQVGPQRPRELVGMSTSRARSFVRSRTRPGDAPKTDVDVAEITSTRG